MERQYSHLTWKNRLKIRRMLDERRKPKEIADALHVHTSTGRSSGGRRGK